MSPVDEEALRKKITDELYKELEQDRAKAEQELQAWLDTRTQMHKHIHTLCNVGCEVNVVYDSCETMDVLSSLE